MIETKKVGRPRFTASAIYGAAATPEIDARAQRWLREHPDCTKSDLVRRALSEYLLDPQRQL